MRQRRMVAVLVALGVLVSGALVIPNGTWTTKAPMPTPRSLPAAGVIDGRLYVASGNDGQWHNADDSVAPDGTGVNRLYALEIYDPALDIWTTGAWIPTPLYAAAAGGIGRKLYVAGGQPWPQIETNLNIAKLQIYDADTNTWSEGTPMPQGRAAPASAVYNDKLFVAGGRNADNSSDEKTLYIYDPAYEFDGLASTNPWSTGAPMSVARQFAAAAFFNGEMYVVGGLASSALGTVEAYNPTTNAWTSKGSLQYPRYALTVAIVGGTLYAAGGHNGTSVLDVVEAYDPVQDEWVVVGSMPAPRSGAVAGVIDETLYLVGGQTTGNVYTDANHAFGIDASSLAVSPAAGTYGGTATLTATLTSGGSPVAGKTVSFAVNGTPAGSATTGADGMATLFGISLAGLNAGVYAGAVEATFAGDSEVGGSTGSADLTVVPALLTVTADDVSREYGADNPEFTASYSGFVNGETLATSGVTGAPLLTTTATSTSPIGTYVIDTALGTLAAVNYGFHLVNGTLTVTEALNITLSIAKAALDAGHSQTCAITAEGRLMCWGGPNYGQVTGANASADLFAHVNAGHYVTCAVKHDGRLACWGWDLDGAVSGPNARTDRFVQVGAGSHHTCGLESNGALACWGHDDYGRVSGPNASTASYLDIDVSAYNTCAVSAEGHLACWGRDLYGESSGPNASDDTYTQVSVNSDVNGHTCAVRADGRLRCWGYPHAGDMLSGPNASTDTFAQVTTGGLHTCGLKNDGQIRCWGLDYWGQISGPNGSTRRFVEISAGGAHTCGLARTGELVCWGSNLPDDYGQVSGPNASSQAFGSAGELLIQHAGGADPLSEGWTQVTGSGGVTVGPVLNDAGTGLNAWFVNDSSTAIGSHLSYARPLTAQEITEANARGWSVRARLRVVGASDGVDSSIYLLHEAGPTGYFLIDFGSDASGNPIVRVHTSQGLLHRTVQGSGYHLYEVRFDPVAGSADLFVDGVEIVSNYTAANPGSTYQVAWGGGQSITTGLGHYNLVHFELHPAPDTDGDDIPDDIDTDDDGDGTPDASDALPLDATETADSDGDGTGDNADTDDDGDGIPDSSDPAPFDPVPTGHTVLLQHVGSNDPVTEAWTQHVGSSGDAVPAGPLINDGGLATWFVDDTSSALGSWRGYRRDLTSGEVATVSSQGWTLRARLKVAGVRAPADGSIYVAYAAGGGPNYAMSFVADADGNAVVRLPVPGGGIDTVVAGSGYHLYELRLDPADGSVDLFVDGVERVSNYTGTESQNAHFVNWGAGASHGMGRGHFNLVQFEAHPAPDTDGDGLLDDVDTDDDGDGTPDASDALPLDATETADSDGDGTGDNADTDDDGDGIPDSSDPAPFDPVPTGHTVLLQHVGSNDPVTEAWTQHVGSSGDAVPAGPLANDGGLPAWFVDDTSTALGSWRGYRRDLTSAEAATVSSQGWTLRARLKIAGVRAPADGSIYVGYAAGAGPNYAMSFVADVDGNAVVRLPDSGGGIDTVVAGSGYHLYELRFDPATGSVGLFVDGVERVSNYTGMQSQNAHFVNWGAGASHGMGLGHFNLVQFEAHPAPDTDGDGILDSSDNCLLVVNADQANGDGDADGDACDPDDDNDGIADVLDLAPLAHSTEYSSSRAWGTGTFGTLIPNGQQLTLTPDPTPEPGKETYAVRGSVSGNPEVGGYFTACSQSTLKQIEMTGGVTADWRCDGSTLYAMSVIGVTALQKSTSSGWVIVDLAAGEEGSIGSPVSAGEGNRIPMPVWVRDEKLNELGSFSLDARESVDVEIVPDRNGLLTIYIDVLNGGTDGSVSFELFGKTYEVSEGDEPDTFSPDVTPPMIRERPDVVAEATSPDGALVHFDLPAVWDDFDPAPVVMVLPASGSQFPLGVTPVTVTATDAAGNSASATFTVTVVDTTPPAITGLSADTPVLWPPNHKMVDVAVAYTATDAVTALPICSLDVQSNEPVNGTGDGDTAPDWEVLDVHRVRLRAERAGSGAGRIYTITVTCADSSGNTASSEVTVSVPRSQGEAGGGSANGPGESSRGAPGRGRTR